MPVALAARPYPSPVHGETHTAGRRPGQAGSGCPDALLSDLPKPSYHSAAKEGPMPIARRAGLIMGLLATETKARDGLALVNP